MHNLGLISSVLHFKPTIAKTFPARGSCTFSVQLEAIPREGVMAINICYHYSLTSGMNWAEPVVAVKCQILSKEGAVLQHRVMHFLGIHEYLDSNVQISMASQDV